MQSTIEAVGRQMRVGAGKSVADVAGVGVNGDAGRAPVREFVGAIGNAAAGDRRVQNNGFEFGDLHIGKNLLFKNCQNQSWL